MKRDTNICAHLIRMGALGLLLILALPLLSACTAGKSEPVTAAPDSANPAFNPVPYDEAPQLLSPIIPKYPSKSLNAGIQGTVLLEVAVTRAGSIHSVVVNKSVDPSTGGLDAAALEAVKKVRFKPAMVDGQEVDALVIIPVQFKLN